MFYKEIAVPYSNRGDLTLFGPFQGYSVQFRQVTAMSDLNGVANPPQTQTVHAGNLNV
jgi:hypothetical protein